VHGGLTFGKVGDGNRFEKGYYWIGWDYAHAGDFSGYNLLLELKESLDSHELHNKKWTTEELIEEVKKAIEQL